MEITNYFSGLTNDLGQCYMLRFKIDHSPRPKEKKKHIGLSYNEERKEKRKKRKTKEKPKELGSKDI